VLNLEQQMLKEAVNCLMPFGKHAGQPLLCLPEPYLVWLHGKGFPEGKLGRQLALIYEVKLNGLEGMLRPLLENDSQSGKFPKNLPPQSRY
jgi:uncharacterized protein (DUF3820 family)